MNKKVLGISSSMRVSGNSDSLCDAFLSGAAKAGNQTEKISLAGRKIAFCTGCWNCRKNGECIYTDDVKEIAEKIMQADIIVLASPIYFYAISGQLKTLIDRMDPYYAKISHKDFYYLFSSADADPSGMDTAVLELRGFVSCLNECHEMGIIRGTDAAEKEDMKKGPHIEEAFLMGTTV